ncbi:MAG: insulinase family protein [Propionibacteriaceae bacterium]|jgi:predicted Zn-dependent peptidase|nr:insulinase family protein [Propionibacteriaceae bacterium]
MRPRPDITAPLSWQFPTPQQSTLSSGIEVWHYRLPGQYVVTARLIIELPLSVEQPQLEGISSLTARCLAEGTIDHPGLSFASAIENLGAQATGAAGNSTVQVTLEAPVTSFGQALPLLAEMTMSPALADDDTDRLKVSRLAEIGQQESHGPYLASTALRQCLLGADSRLTRPAGGLSASVAALSGTEVRDFHQRHYGPRDAILVIAGDLEHDQVEAYAQASLGSWKSATSAISPAPVRPGPGRRAIIDRPGAVQADLAFGWFGIDQADRRWAALQVACTIVGGSFTSRINHRLREELGYTYGVSLEAMPFRQGGLIYLTAATRTEVALAAVAEIMDLLALKQAFTADEVSQAINYMRRSAPLLFDTAESVAGQAASLAAGRLPIDQVSRYLEELANVSAAQAMDAFTSLVTPASASIIAVAEAGGLGASETTAPWLQVPVAPLA